MAITQREIDRFLSDAGGALNNSREAGYAALVLRELFGLDDKRAARQAGENSSGLNAYHLDRDRRNLHLIVARWGTDYRSFERPLNALINGGLARVFATDTHGEHLEPFMRRLKAELAENRAVIDNVFLRFVFTGDVDLVDQSELMKSLQEDLEAKKAVVDDYFGPDRQVSLAITFSSSKTEDNTFTTAQTTHRYTVDFTPLDTVTMPSAETLHLGLIRLADLNMIHKGMGQRFFERNIRSGLNKEKAPNREIRKAIKRIVDGDEPPEVFTFNHNGITIAAEDLELGDGHAFITEPRLLNGAQTVTSLEAFREDTRDKPLDAEAEAALNEIRVIAKIISSAERDFVVNVTICNNRQNPVEPWNLRANDRIQLLYQDWFRERLGIYYERQENSFANLTGEDLEELGIQDARSIQIKTLAQTLLASQGEIDKMARLREVFEDERLYDRTFRESYLSTSPHGVVLAYKIHNRLGSASRELIEAAPDRFKLLGRARNLIWALLIQGILNDREIASLKERFGTSLRQETEYTERLKALAANKVRLLMTDLAKDAKYQRALDDGNDHFLRTRAAFQQCMVFAKERYGWHKASLS
jgi:hypothetical protein